jgi:hypothetical protein
MRRPCKEVKMKGAGSILLLVAVLFFSFACTKRADEETDGTEGTENDYKVITSEGITLKWKADTLDLLHVKVSATTRGWVAVGFGPTDKMKDANFIIGYVEAGNVRIRDDFGTGQFSHASDTSLGGTDDVTNKEGTETNGNTEISFTVPLDSGDSYDRALAVGQSYLVILAHGSDNDDNFTTHHQTRTSVNIEL